MKKRVPGKIPNVSLDDFEHIDPAVIHLSAIQKPNSGYSRLWEVYEEYKEAGCTPVFIQYRMGDEWVTSCVAEEYFNSWLH